MNQVAYSYERGHSARYIFTSVGKRRIEKAVEFVSVGMKNLVNLGFGDLRPDGSLDDTVHSNNGDIVKVLATVIAILKEYTAQNPQTEVFFTGSTIERTRLYTRILTVYYPVFSTDFRIVGITRTEGKTSRTSFNPTSNLEYLAFLIKRI